MPDFNSLVCNNPKLTIRRSGHGWSPLPAVFFPVFFNKENAGVAFEPAPFPPRTQPPEERSKGFPVCPVTSLPIETTAH